MFFDNFLKLCNDAKKSPSAVAEEMGYQRSVVTRWSKGTVPRRATLQRIACYFGVSVEWLSGNADENAQKNSTAESGAELSPIKKRLLQVVENASDEDLQKLLELMEILKK